MVPDKFVNFLVDGGIQHTEVDSEKIPNNKSIFGFVIGGFKLVKSSLFK